MSTDRFSLSRRRSEAERLVQVAYAVGRVEEELKAVRQDLSSIDDAAFIKAVEAVIRRDCGPQKWACILEVIRRVHGS